MDKAIFQEVPEESREQYIRDNAVAFEEVGYMRRFTSDELSIFKSDLSETSIEQNDLEEERKQLVADLTKKIKDLQAERKVLLRRLKLKAEHVKETCFKFHNEQTRTVGYYNSLGELVYSRPMEKEEMQLIMPLRSVK